MCTFTNEVETLYKGKKFTEYSKEELIDIAIKGWKRAQQAEVALCDMRTRIIKEHGIII